MTTAENFAATGIELYFRNPHGEAFRPVFIPSSDAVAWDAPAAETNCTVYSERYDVHCYAELRITGRRVRCHTGGIWGTAARVRYTGEDTGEWIQCVVLADIIGAM